MKRRMRLSICLSVLLTIVLTACAGADEVKINASDGAARDYFGGSVFISGDYAIVGAFGDGDSGLTSGSAYILKRDDMSWNGQAKLVASDGAAGDYFQCPSQATMLSWVPMVMMTTVTVRDLSTSTSATEQPGASNQRSLQATAQRVTTSAFQSPSQATTLSWVQVVMMTMVPIRDHHAPSSATEQRGASKQRSRQVTAQQMTISAVLSPSQATTLS